MTSPLPDTPEAPQLDPVARLLAAAGRDLDPDAVRLLCTALDDDPAALDLAGNSLNRQPDLTPARLLDALQSLRAIQPGLRGLPALIEARLRSVDGSAREVFTAFGAFAVPGLTEELLAVYLAQGQPGCILPGASLVQSVIKRLSSRSKREAGIKPLKNSGERLRALCAAGLLVEQIGTEKQPTVYQMPEAVHTVARSLVDTVASDRAIETCLTWLTRYDYSLLSAHQPLLPGIDGLNRTHLDPELIHRQRLLPIMATLTGAAQQAQERQKWKDAAELVEKLIPITTRLDQAEYRDLLIQLLHTASVTATWTGNLHQQHRYLHQLAKIYEDQGQDDKHIEVLKQFIETNSALKYWNFACYAAISLGRLYAQRDLEVSDRYFQQALQFAGHDDDLGAQTVTLLAMGIASYNTGNYRRATLQFGQSLKFARQSGDQTYEIETLKYLGDAYYRFGNYRRAIASYEQARQANRERKVPGIEEYTLRWIHHAYINQADWQQAIEFGEHALNVYREAGNKEREVEILRTVVEATLYTKDYPASRVYLERALTIYQEIGSRNDELYTLFNLGIVFHNLEDYQRAAELFVATLTYYRETGNRRLEGYSLLNAGSTFMWLDRFEEAFNYLEQSLIIARELNDQLLEAYTVSNSAYTFAERNGEGDLARALELYPQAKAIYRELKLIDRMELVDIEIAEVLAKQDTAAEGESSA